MIGRPSTPIVIEVVAAHDVHGGDGFVQPGAGNVACPKRCPQAWPSLRRRPARGQAPSGNLVQPHARIRGPPPGCRLRSARLRDGRDRHLVSTALLEAPRASRVPPKRCHPKEVPLDSGASLTPQRGAAPKEVPLDSGTSLTVPRFGEVPLGPSDFASVFRLYSAYAPSTPALRAEPKRCHSIRERHSPSPDSGKFPSVRLISPPFSVSI